MRHRGVQAGNPCPGGKQTGPELTGADEGVLALLPSQTAVATATARSHRGYFREAARQCAPLHQRSPSRWQCCPSRRATPASSSRNAALSRPNAHR